MPEVCILTDSTAQFVTPHFPGRERVFVVPLAIQHQGRVARREEDLKVDRFPASARRGLHPLVLPPSVADFEKTFLYLGQQYHQIVVLLLSARLCPAISAASQAAENVQGHFSVHILDTQTTGGGLGLLVQYAAAAAAAGQDARQIDHLIHGLLPRLYTVFAVQGLTYLAHANFLDPAQALVGELLGLTPFFIFDNGELISTHKVRNPRHLVDSLVEFVCEFGDIQHLALMQGAPPLNNETRTWRERVAEYFPATPLSEHAINPSLAAILGPHSVGMFVLEGDSDQR
jgi:DegV family protein with EDD domain